MARRKRNVGYWYRKDRGYWVASAGKNKYPPLADEAGNRLTDPKATQAAKRAYARWLAGDPQETVAGATVDEVCLRFLDSIEHGNQTTYRMRADDLHNFCKGLPDRLRGSKERPAAADRIHPGYGARAAASLTWADIDDWLAANEDWGIAGRGRRAYQGLRRAFNFGVERKLLESNPIKGYPVPQTRARATYYTPEIEEALIAGSTPAMALALRVLIRTGVRPVCEFAALTADRVEETAKGQIWRFPEGSKGSKKRDIYVPAEIAQLVREQMADHPGQVFRNERGKPWVYKALKSAFERARNKVKAQGLPLCEEACLYTCRHTFAKRMLTGYWTGKPITLEFLSKLMGNTIEVCWRHYAQWSEAHTDPLWEAIDG